MKDPAPWFVLPSRTTTWNERYDIHTGRCTVESDGHVVCVPRTVYSSLCAPDLTYWPYDVVNCSVVIGAWMQAGEEITVNNDQGNVSIYQLIVQDTCILEHAVAHLVEVSASGGVVGIFPL